jgi:hypothetical protein
MSYLNLMKEVWEFIKQNKKWWLIPVFIALIVTGILIMTAGTTSVPVFIYPVV